MFEKNGKEFVTCGQMKVLEQRADEAGLSYYQMMENAGASAAKVIMAETEELRAAGGGVRVLVFCGKGNNGGDGLVVARLLCEAGCKPHVILTDGEPVTEDARRNFELLSALDVTVDDMTKNDRVFIELGYRPDIIVDAIYGTGFRGALRGNGLKAVIYINNCKNHEQKTAGRPLVFALDIPSGLGGDMIKEEEMGERSVMADCTIVFHSRKPVHVQEFAQERFGEIVVCDIGIDERRLWHVGT